MNLKDIKWKKPDIKGQISCDCIYMWYLVQEVSPARLSIAYTPVPWGEKEENSFFFPELSTSMELL